jgi:hypothetical protein
LTYVTVIPLEYYLFIGSARASPEVRAFLSQFTLPIVSFSSYLNSFYLKLDIIRAIVLH